MEAIAEFIGATVGTVMRAIDWLTGKRRDWFEERK